MNIIKLLNAGSDKSQDNVCIFNNTIICNNRRCNSCGWNPSVFEMRKKAILQSQEAEKGNDCSKNLGVHIRRNGSKVYENISYLGLYQMFSNDRTLTIPRLTAIMFSDKYTKKHISIVERICAGNKTSLPIEAIKKLIQYSGMTFEQLFEERKI